MKKIILSVALSFLLFANLNAQWEVLQEGFNGNINSIYFVDENTGWLAGSNGMLSRTTDGGENWLTIPFDETWSIYKIDFINELVGWAVGSRYDSISSYGMIIKTTDGGNTWWMQKEILGEWFDLIHAVDENNIYTAGANKIYKSSNGGSGWFNISPNLPDRYLNSLWFRDSLNGIITGNYYGQPAAKSIILKTSDGGLSWTENDVSEFNSISDLKFFNDSTGYFKAYKDTVSYFCKTEDMLSTWSIMSSNSFSLGSYDILSTNLVYGIKSGGVNKVIRSTDGGKNWQDVQTLISGNQNQIYIINNTSGYIIGNLGWGLGAGVSVLFRSTDLNNWIFQKSSLPLNDICFTDNNRGFMATGVNDFHSSNGLILSTMNNGRSLEMNYSSRAAFISCSSVDENLIFMLSPFGVFKTADAGLSWDNFIFNSDSLGFWFNAGDIFFTDQQNGWIGGNYNDNTENGAALLKTSNQGETWELAFKYKADLNTWYTIHSLSFTGAGGWAAGENGLLLKYSNFSGWRRVESGTPLSLKKVFFYNDYYGWIVGGNFDGTQIISVLMKTTDGGITWQKKQGPEYIINDLWFVNTWHGWAVGYDKKFKGVILETRDGGNNWTVVIDNLMGPMKSIFIKDKLGWASGEKGLLLHTTNTGPVWVEDDDNIPERYSLGQNYPNPFNPSTTIEFEIPEASAVSLIVYDILGREAAVLVNEQKTPGRYQVQFNGNNLASGLYIYKLKSEAYTSSKKMLLLK